jgi:uncharacterized membrane protein YccC
LPDIMPNLPDFIPKPDELIFALKTFAGAMAALYLSLWLGLDAPYWALATSYIVSLPFAGGMRSKSLYRIIGTLIGGAAAVAMVPNLVNAPVLLCLALALWIGMCLYISLLDRTPRAYLPMLAGYTAGIIGFPSVFTPDHVFHTAVTRMEEISIGIACSTVVGTLIFPRALGPVLSRRIGGWAKPAREWAIAALSGDETNPAAAEGRRRLPVETTEITGLITQLAYDTSPMQSAVRYVTRLRLYLISLVPVLASIGTRVTQLENLGAITPQLRRVLDNTKRWMEAGNSEDADALVADIITLEEEDEHDWAGLLRASLALRLQELVSLVRHSRAIRRHIRDGDPLPSNDILDREFVASIVQNRDHTLALLSALAAALAVLLVCAMWIWTDWPNGAGAAVMVAIACSFFATQDNPAPAIASMVKASFFSLAGVGIYDYAVLTRIYTFEGLCLALLPAGLLVGVLISRPKTFMMGMNITATGATQLALENGFTGSFTAWANNSLAVIFGLTSALVMTLLIRSFGAAWTADRLMRASWRGIARAAEGRGTEDGSVLIGLTVDRLGLMLPRLAGQRGIDADASVRAELNNLRVGLDMLGLHHELWRVSPTARMACETIFKGVAAHYRGNPRRPAPPALCEAIDNAINLLVDDPHIHKTALMHLSGLRSVLFPEAAPPAIPAWTTEGKLHDR